MSQPDERMGQAPGDADGLHIRDIDAPANADDSSQEEDEPTRPILPPVASPFASPFDANKSRFAKPVAPSVYTPLPPPFETEAENQAAAHHDAEDLGGKASEAPPKREPQAKPRAASPDIDDEPIFWRPGVQKLGIIGGKGVGKSYLFQAMVYRTYSNSQAGALAYYLDRGGIRLRTALSPQDPETEVNLSRFIDNYVAWNRLNQTTLEAQRWYRLSLPYRTGIFGHKRSELDVEFFEASGEGLLQLEYMGKEELELWKAAYLDASVMVFCLPLWAAFPNAELTDADWQDREDILKGFEQVVLNYQQLRGKFKRRAAVRSILALTMADDRRCALVHLQDRWITPYLNAPQSYLRSLVKGRGVAQYLENARKVSNAVSLEFEHSHDPRVSGIPNRLDFGNGQPWMVPLSAVEGAELDGIEKQYAQKNFPGRFAPPVPAHVELPLLVALCDRENALM